MNVNFKQVDSSPEEIAYALNRSRKLSINFLNFNFLNFYEKLIYIHYFLFQDLYSSEGSLKCGKITKVKECKNLMAELSSELLDADKKIKPLSAALAKFFINLINLKPFAYGNHFVGRKFLYELTCNMVEFDLLPRSLDFRKLKISELDENVSLEKLTSLFYNAIREKTKPAFKAKVQEWPNLPDAGLKVGGFRFLTYRGKYLVAQNGGLIEINAISIGLENFLRKGGHPSEFKLPRDAFENYIFNDDPLSTLDGVPFEDEVLLVCLDIDYLTGLTFGKEFNYFADYITQRDINVLEFPEYAMEQNVRSPILQRAAVYITEIRDFIKIVRNKYISGKTSPSVTPKFFMSMGGTGSGKSSLKKHADVFCGQNLVRASIDSIRSKSKLYDFYLICNHHSDDYKSLIYLSYVIIASITHYVIKNKLNYFKDTSGIPYGGRNDMLVKIFKKSGYETFVLSAAAALYVESEREDLDVPVHERIIKRYAKKRRAVPWNIVIKKHIDHPYAQCEAALDPYLDYLIIYDTMVPRNRTKVLAKSVDITHSELTQLQEAKQSSQEALFDKIQELEIIRFEELDIDFKINQIDFILNQYDANKKIYQVLIILNKIKMLDLIQKGALNINAKGYEALVFNTHPEHIPQLDYPAFILDKEVPNRLRNQINYES